MTQKSSALFVGLVVIGFLLGCSSLPLPAVPGSSDAKRAVKKAVTEGTVKVLDIQMDKKMDGDVGIVTVTGHAVYTPAKVGAKAFNDYQWDVKIAFFDEQGRKLPFEMGWLEYGEYWKSENVIPDEPFPFRGEMPTHIIKGGLDTFNKAVSCKVRKFEAIG